MKLIIVFGFLLVLGFAHSQTNCAKKNPNVSAPKTWVPKPGCPDGSFYETGANGLTRCHCWSMCGYICDPDFPRPSPPTVAPPGPTVAPPATTPTKPTSTTLPTTVAPAPATCLGGKVIFIPNQATATAVCICVSPPTGYTCSSIA